MTELIEVIKTLFISALLVTLMQIRVSGQTIESYSESWLEKSKVAYFVQGAAAGGVLAVRDLYHSVLEAWTGSKKPASESKAFK